MKPFAVTLLIVVVFAIALPVSAQCLDWASCVGQKAEINARMGSWARETAEARAAERQAAATERAYNRMVALTATEIARPTRTPWPTLIVPSATVQATATPQPIQSLNVATVAPTLEVTKIVYVTVSAQPKQGDQLPQIGWWAIGAAGIGLILFAAAGLRKPTTQ